MPRVATVSYLNARPLIHGLDAEPGVEIIRRVPSGLLTLVEEGRADVALCPVIDYQRSVKPLEIVPAGAIGCNGPALTVKLFAGPPIEELERVAVDGDSHTSVALLTVILRSVFDVDPHLVPLEEPADAVLLIGDKVIHRPPDPAVFHRTLDLGAAWKDMTGLPFVFAAWMSALNTELGDLPSRLDRIRISNRDQLAEIARSYGDDAGWPADLAAGYLTRNLRYELGDRELQAIETFWRLCLEHRLIDKLRPMRLYGRES